MGKGGSQKIGDFEITMTHALHSNSIDDKGVSQYGGEPAGYIIRLPDAFTVYHAGDTALFGDMKLIGELYKPDLAMLPIEIGRASCRERVERPGVAGRSKREN